MKKYYDIICLGYGPVTRQLIEYFTEYNFLIVSDRQNIELQNAKSVTYSKFALLIKNLSFTHVIVTIRLEFLSAETLNYVTHDREFWEFMCKCKVIVLSSVSVYGNSPKVHFELDSLYPLDEYSLKKMELENLFVQNLATQKLLILRISNLYGVPGLSTFFDNLKHAVHLKTPFSIPKTMCIRDFVNIYDFCKFVAYWKIYDVQINYQVMNFGTGVSTNLSDIIQLVQFVLGKDFETNIDLQEPVISVSRISIDRLRLVWSKTLVEFDSAVLKSLIFN